ncbi:MAG: hypothetical protein IJD48_03200 [Clostridia bacterium]|nr:hypothetical protein [Clostridia bacterium]
MLPAGAYKISCSCCPTVSQITLL